MVVFLSVEDLDLMISSTPSLVQQAGLGGAHNVALSGEFGHVEQHHFQLSQQASSGGLIMSVVEQQHCGLGGRAVRREGSGSTDVHVVNMGCHGTAAVTKSLLP